MRRTLSIGSVLWFASAGALRGASGPEGMAEEKDSPMLVVLRDSAAVPGPFVRLGDVAQLPNDPFRLRRYASDLLLGFAPERGSMREIDSREVAARLRQAGIGERRFLIKGAARTSVLPAEPVAERAAAARSTAPALGSGPDRGVDRSVEGRSAAGPVARAPVRKGSASAPTDALPGPDAAVLKDSRVVLRSVGSALVLEEPAVALTAGDIGGLIEVQNVRTSQRLVAKVVGKGEAIPQEPAAPRRLVGTGEGGGTEE